MTLRDCSTPRMSVRSLRSCQNPKQDSTLSGSLHSLGWITHRLRKWPRQCEFRFLRGLPVSVSPFESECSKLSSRRRKLLLPQRSPPRPQRLSECRCCRLLRHPCTGFGNSCSLGSETSQVRGRPVQRSAQARSLATAVEQFAFLLQRCFSWRLLDIPPTKPL